MTNGIHLIMYLGYEIAGGKMKATGTLDWLPPNTGATNESGFNALPGGFRNAYYKDFHGFRASCFFWHSETPDARGVTYNSADVINGTMSLNSGLSVRCVRD